MVSVGSVHLSKVENGHRPCSRELAKKIAVACKVPVWTLYRDLPEDLMLTERERDLLTRFRRLGDGDRGRLLGYLDGMPDGGGKVEPLNADEIRRFRAGLRRNLIEPDPVEKQGPPSSGDEGAAANG